MVDKIKVIPDNIEELLTPLAFTIWYLDDGGTDWGHRNGVRPSNRITPSCKICTECFTNEDQEKLVHALKNKLNINSKLYKSKHKNRTRLYMRGKENAYNALKIINEYTPTEDMLYKSDSKAYEKMKNCITQNIYDEDIIF